ncbi:flavocytochrome c [Clostridium sp. AN503]|uniref:flavocytochrome c n=1 Tax=Clostridium sp. AN503 TaxID=3160598 RepID=UPI003458D3FA
MRKSGRKLMSVAVAAAMVLSLAACGGKTADTTTAATTEAATEATTAAESTEAETEAAKAENQQADIVVIGAGGAGMTAAIQAVQDGATDVVVLEKMPITGGNTTRSTGGLNACATTYQEADGIEDSVELFVEDTMKGGKELNDKELVTVMAENSAAAVDWVNEIGGDLSVVGMFGGASVKRIHRPSDTSAVGPMLVKTLNAKMEELNIPVLLETTAKQILVNDKGAVSGVVAVDKDGNEMTIDCTAVILATGGFGANAQMVEEYKPDLKGFGTTNHAGATGDGIAMAKELGAAFVDMDQVQTHPTVNPETQTMYTEGVRGNGAILVNKEGKRFVNELETRDVVSAAILEQTDGECYMVFDQAVRDSLSAIESYIKAGIVSEAETPEELGEAIGIDGAALAETLSIYAGYQESGKDDDFGRESMELPLTEPKYYAALCAPAIHHTMGGVKINTSCEVLKEDGNAVAGLFAAGEITGGVHGANRLGGNAVTDIVVFGRIAGTSAEDYVMANGGHTEAEITAGGDEAAAAPEAQGNYKDGVYEGTGKGNNGDIKVEVKVEGGNITAITLKEHGETEGIYEAAEKNVVADIIKTQNAEVDAVSGATNTSNGIMEAVANALKDAK